MLELVNWPTAITSICGLGVGFLTYLNTNKLNKRAKVSETKLDINVKLTQEMGSLIKIYSDLISNKKSANLNSIQQAEIIILNSQQKAINAAKLADNLNGLTLFNKILVVEDDIIDAQLFCRTLEKVNLVGTIASGSVEAFAMIASNQYDAAFIDLSLSDYLSGYDLIKVMTIIRPDMPLFVATGYCDESITEAIKLLGAIAILQKPVTLEDLIALFKSLANKTN